MEEFMPEIQIAMEGDGEGTAIITGKEAIALMQEAIDPAGRRGKEMDKMGERICHYTGMA